MRLLCLSILAGLLSAAHEAGGTRPQEPAPVVDAGQLLALTRQQPRTWVVLWAPWCEPWAQHAREYQAQLAKYPAKNIRLVVVAIHNDPQVPAISRRVLGQAGLTAAAYAIDEAHYGPKADLKFRQELSRLAARKAPRHAVHYLFDQHRGLVAASDQPEMTPALQRALEQL
jgi:hypothetical protein